MIFSVLTVILLCFYSSALYAQSYTQTIDKNARFSEVSDPGNEVKIYNIQGDVSVKGYDGNEIRITAQQVIKGTDAEIKQAKEELKLVVEQDGNHIYVYIDAPFVTVKKNRDGIHYSIDNWDGHYKFRYDITMLIPKHAHIYASTINDGLVTINNTTARVSAFNVNGKVKLSNITGPTKAHTVNGNINIQYDRSPTENSDYKTINGTIEVNYPGDLSADIRFKSMNGELYTDFQNIKRLPAKVKTDKKHKGSAVRYTIDRFTPLRIGRGGPTFNFEVLNGDVYIKQIKS